MKTNNIIRTAGFVIITILLFSACDSYLDLSPSDVIDNSKAFETVTDLEQGIIGVYASIGNHSTEALSSRASDDLRLSSQNRGQGIQIHNWTYNANTSDIASIYPDMYHSIDRANRILAAAEKFDAEDQMVQQIKGEAFFIRAYCHFELSRAYCKPYVASDPKGIPYMTESIISKPARINQSEVYANMLADIETALSYLPDYNEDYGRASTNGIKALKTKVLLYQGNWDAVIEIATDLIAASGIRLATYDEVAALWNDAAPENVEILFELRRTTGNARLGNIYTDTNGDIFFHPAIDLMNHYAPDDIRYLSYFGLNNSGDQIVTKHDGREDGISNLVNYKSLRLSEIYLMRAEAYVEKELLSDAATDVNTLRANRMVNPVELDFSSKEAALESLQNERRRELAYEGNRFYDLNRWGLGIERIPEDAELASNSVLEAGDYHFVFPIPQQEIFANENMDQNDGYSNN